MAVQEVDPKDRGKSRSPAKTKDVELTSENT